MPTPPADLALPSRWQRFSAAFMRAFHRYATWLVGIGWGRFFLLALLLLILSSVAQKVPPFRWELREVIEGPRQAVRAPRPPLPPVSPSVPTAPTAPTAPSPPAAPPAPDPSGHVDAALAQTEAAASAARGALEAARKALPAGTGAEVGRALDQARRDIDDALREARDDIRAAAEEARAEVATDTDVQVDADGTVHRVRVLKLGSHLPDLAFLWIVASAIIKTTYKRQIQAEAQAAQAVETAESESLKRQVVEARMAAMQAQVEPHFLFNTLASIDHLIEVDPKRASQMQKHLIALLRATMPTLRETSASAGPRDLGRELAVIRPYLEILKVRMEERLVTEIAVPDGLLSAEFPPMMIQTLVENAIQHGLEPQPEGGRLRVAAEIVHGKLAVTVADTGLGFGQAGTTGTGVGLANIRERLALQYGGAASLSVAANPGGGTRVTLAVPYRPLEASPSRA
jgi:Histidine kinase